MNLLPVLIFGLLYLPSAFAQLDFWPAVTSNLIGPITTLSLQDGTVLFIGSSQDPSTGRHQIVLQRFVPPNAVNSAQIITLASLATGGDDQPSSATIDPTGNIWIAGTTNSDDFKLVSPIMGQKVPYRRAGFVIELDPTAKNLLFASTISGHQPTVYNANQSSGLSTSATAIAVDTAGNIYVGGSTNEADFPTTPGAYRSGGGSYINAEEQAYYKYLVKISPARKLLYSTSIATGITPCSGGSACLFKDSGSGSVVALAADSSGSAIVGAIYGGGVGVVNKFSPDGSTILWSAQPAFSYGYVSDLKVAEDSAGNVDIFGLYFASVSPIGSQGPLTQYQTPGLFAARFSSTGNSTYAQDLGKSADSTIIGAVVDTSGNAYFAGRTSSSALPVLSGVPPLGSDFIFRFTGQGLAPAAIFRFPAGTLLAAPAFRNGLLLLPSADGALIRVSPTPDFTKPAIFGYANAASFQMSSAFYPGTLTTLFGWGLTSSTADVQISVNGQNAPVLYAGLDQITFQVPSLPAYVNMPITVQVQLPSQTLTITSVLKRSLGLFTLDGSYAAALNQDGTVNSASNPAARGSVISLFGTGVLWDPGFQAGQVATTAIPANLDHPKGWCQIFCVNANFSFMEALPFKPREPAQCDPASGR